MVGLEVTFAMSTKGPEEGEAWTVQFIDVSKESPRAGRHRGRALRFDEPGSPEANGRFQRRGR